MSVAMYNVEVKGAYKATGEEARVTLLAPSIGHAEESAAMMGILVEESRILSDEEFRQRHTLDYDRTPQKSAPKVEYTPVGGLQSVPPFLGLYIASAAASAIGIVGYIAAAILIVGGFGRLDIAAAIMGGWMLAGSVIVHAFGNIGLAIRKIAIYAESRMN